MGLMKGLTEAWLQGTTFGFSDKVGLTGAGGLVHDSSDEVAHFDIDEEKYPASELMYRINCVLPASIKILSLEYYQIMLMN